MDCITKMKLMLITLCSVVLISTVSQAAPNGVRQPLLFKYGNNVVRRLGSYVKPLLVGTEDTATKLTRDVQYGSLSAVKVAIESLIFANKMISNLLHYMNGTRVLRNVRSPIKFSSPST